ncbi:MAG TPA: dTMP kinase [Candidatus Saccharimonadales bacterium]|nr:dTMP kinase [Candidatus Saccharimonadales bacterium]
MTSRIPSTRNGSSVSQVKHEQNNKKIKFIRDPGIKYLKDIEINGSFIVIEGPDASGRSTQIQKITQKLEADGHAVVNTGLKRSDLISKGIIEAKRNYVGRRTMALYYAADFADQLENRIIPALKAGFVVISDRYIYTLIARSSVRGINKNWLHQLHSFAIKPDLIFYLDVDPHNLIHRVFKKNKTLDYYESGADLGISDDIFDSFIKYQYLLKREFNTMQKKYGLLNVNGDNNIDDIYDEIQSKISNFLNITKKTETII